MRKCKTVNDSERIESFIINPLITLYSDPNLYIEVTEMNSTLAYKWRTIEQDVSKQFWLSFNAHDQIIEMYEICQIKKKKNFSMKATVDQAKQSISAVNAGV